jgi:hypothetical protein
VVRQAIDKRVHKKFIPVNINTDIIYQGARVIKNSGRKVNCAKRLKEAKRESKRSFLVLSSR